LLLVFHNAQPKQQYGEPMGLHDKRYQ